MDDNGYSEDTKTILVVVDLQREIARLKAELDALHAADRQRTLLVDALQAELAALRPWAEVGKRAVREQWWQSHHAGEWKRVARCCDAQPPEPGEDEGWIHAPGCPIPSLIAQLGAEDA